MLQQLFGIPDPNAYRLMPITVEAEIDRDGNVRKDKDDRIKFGVQTLVTPLTTDFKVPPYVIKIVIASNEVPVFVPGQEAEFIGLAQRAWEFNDKWGISFSATGFRQGVVKAVRADSTPKVD